ncbi:uncharacterized protein LOC116127810 [Pistacia vera]|uniref:uncharacterized protein LOC116115481 n=1 Tax=Pistacia vera TaxID=55513 RepID=UPI001262C014|nr:uncharacterized protein LOC116115481 [Pistacia vera]XP_031269333.1 uncharacterized protein LOC116127810 [Pistacia vera]XP_031269334.1 uncharacterized protein LOC116127810 [Pistacia vera]
MSATICNSNLICCYTKQTPIHPAVGLRIQNQLISRTNQSYPKKNLSRKFLVFAVTEGSAKSSKSEETIPSWAKPDSEEPPPWARQEAKDYSSQQGFEIPFYVYLLASTITAIAAIGSIFEYVNQKPVFGILNSDSIFYAPLLGFFAFTGIPTSAFLWFKSVQAANKEAEDQDRRDGYM